MIESNLSNGDKIREMPDVSLARWLSNVIACQYCPASPECHGWDGSGSCKDRLREWLQSEAKKDD